MLQEYITPNNLTDTLDLLSEYQHNARIIAGATDLLLEMEKGGHRDVTTLIDISRIKGLDSISLNEEGNIHLGPLVTHNQCCSSKLIQEYAFPLAKASWQVGSPQIRNRGTIAGNVITASPANDTIPPLFSLGARLLLVSRNGVREVALDEFYQGIRKTILKPDEILAEIIFPALKQNQHGNFYKLALRKAQAISLVNTAIVLKMNGPLVEEARISLGSVAPTIVRAYAVEEYLKGKSFSEENINEASSLVELAIRPISDVRDTQEHRQITAEVVVRRCLEEIRVKGEKKGFPSKPVQLTGQKSSKKNDIPATLSHTPASLIETTINGNKFKLANSLNKTLLRAIREEAGLTGTKEGCDEGECGACTVFLDGMAVMSCLVPAPRAHGAEIVTIEGISSGDQLHPVQAAFIEKDAVQCGYCTPGFVMSAVKLLEEKANPTLDEIKQSVTGNLCRCTGYYKIIRAIESAASVTQKI